MPLCFSLVKLLFYLGRFLVIRCYFLHSLSPFKAGVVPTVSYFLFVIRYSSFCYFLSFLVSQLRCMVCRCIVQLRWMHLFPFSFRDPRVKTRGYSHLTLSVSLLFISFPPLGGLRWASFFLSPPLYGRGSGGGFLKSISPSRSFCQKSPCPSPA
jgi:hypothetical protein